MKILGLIFTLVSSSAALAQLPLLPQDSSIQTDAFHPAFTAEIQSLAARFKAGVQAHAGWLEQYLEDHPLPPGGILPYHENFGISEQEYRTFVEAASKPLPFVRYGFVTVAFEKTGKTTRIRITGIPSKIGDFIIDTEKRVVRCEVGESELGEEVDVKPGGALGAWRGIYFRYPRTDGKTAPHGSVSLGRDENGLSFIYVEMRSYDDAETEPLVVLLKWPSQEGPNQPPQRNAGSRPSSDGSPASETPSSLGPRG